MIKIPLIKIEFWLIMAIINLEERCIMNLYWLLIVNWYWSKLIGGHNE